jgi:hypothetical protein
MGRIIDNPIWAKCAFAMPYFWLNVDAADGLSLVDGKIASSVS